MDESGKLLDSSQQQKDRVSFTIVAKRFCSRRFLLALVLGQFVSLLVCGTAVSSGLLQEHGVNIPTAQSFLNYFLLAVVFTLILGCRQTGRSLTEVFRDWWWKYLLIAAVDVEANYLVVKAYAYTTVTSVQLLDCFSLFSVLILSRIFLGARYKFPHIGGALTCLLGLVGLVLTDLLLGRNQNSASNVALGDVLIIIGATLYGISNVCQEYVVRTYDQIEFLSMVGIFGSIINGAQLLILERNEVSSLDLSSIKTVIPLVIFVICLFLLYSVMPIVIKQTSATTVNLSILSADFYTLLFGLFLFNYKFHILYFVSFVVILIGLAVYTLSPTSQTTDSTTYNNSVEITCDSSSQQPGHNYSTNETVK